MEAIIALILAAIVIWFLYRYVKHNPGAFSKANMNKSFYTMGILALVLIAFIASLVLLLRAA